LTGLGRLFAGVFVASLLGAGAARAFDYQPGDFVPLPWGTNLLITYFSFNNSSEYVTGNGHDVPRSALQTNVGILRYDHYFHIGDLETDVTAVVPFGGFSKAELGGQDMSHANFSNGDVEGIFTFWPINDPKNQRYLAIATYVSVPAGQYQSNTQLSLNDHRWSVNIEPDFFFAATPKITFDIGGDVTFWGRNDAAYGGGTLTQDPSANLIIWGTYHFTKATNLSLGVVTNWIGEQKLEGQRLGSGVEVTPRVALIQQTSANSEFLVQVSTDAYARNTFKNNIGALLREVIVF
jgi:hypothetical protein